MVEGDDHQILADRYRLTDAIGRGGMADVYSAEDTQSGRMVAVKVMRIGDAADPDRFASEMAILDRLDHRAIVKLFDTGRTSDDSPYFVMQLIEGESLSTRLREEGPLPEPDLIKVAVRVAGGLSHAHAAGVVHRDIKPANILIDEDGRGFLTDFGVARLVGSALVTRTGTTIGTAAYLAPEQLQNSSVGPAADIYSFGLVLIEAFTGRRSFRGSGVESAMARLGRDPEIPDDLPDNWRGLLLAMTRRDPERRPDAGFVEGVLRGHTPPPPLDPVELAARSSPANLGDDEPTAITPMPGEQTAVDGGSGQWGPPSRETAAPKVSPPAASTPPPGQLSVDGSGPLPSGAASASSDELHVASAVPQPGPFGQLRPVLMLLAMGIVGMFVVISLGVFVFTTLLGDDADSIVGDRPVDDATREVLVVLDAGETLRTADPSLQLTLRMLSDDLVEAVNDGRYDAALGVTLEMTDQVQMGIGTLDIDAVTFRPLLASLRELTTAIQADQASPTSDTG